MKFTVFYSWQDDLPNNTNRGFILNALEHASKELGKDATVGIEPVIERDTMGIPGAPNIADTIFKKIDACDLFVCDVSIINLRSRKFRKVPNPNVLVELGYAMKKLGSERLVLLVNTHFGSIDKLPFDLRPRRVIPYRASPGTDNRDERLKLARALRTAIAGTLMALASAPPLEVQLADIKRRELYGRTFELQSIHVSPLHEDDLPVVRGSGGTLDMGLLNVDFYQELSQYVAVAALVQPLGFAVTNHGSHLAESVRAEIAIPKEEHYVLLDETTFPPAPQRRGPFLPRGLGAQEDVWLEEHERSFTLNVDFGDVQPKATVWTGDVVYVGAMKACTLTMPGLLFSDHTEPVRFEFKVGIGTAQRAMTVDDLLNQERALEES